MDAFLILLKRNSNQNASYGFIFETDVRVRYHNWSITDILEIPTNVEK